MKIAYIVSWDITRNDGVTRKIKEQIDSWKSFGEEVVVFCCTTRLGKSNLDAKQFLVKNSLISKFLGPNNFVKEIELYNPDIIYLRFELFKPYLKYLISKIPTIVEINTDDIAELKASINNIRNYIKYIYNKITRNYLLNNVIGLIYVTNEIAKTKGFKKINKKIKYQIIPNGISYKNNIIIKNNVEDEKANLVFIGTEGQSWHGIDRIYEMAVKLGNLYEFHIIGVKNGPSNKNIHYYGFLKQSEYVDILKKCHIAIGTMALYRKGLKEACPLKVREYAVSGFPIILGYNDTAVMGKNIDWIYYVKNSSEKLSKEELKGIKSFIDNNKYKIVSHKESIEYFDIERMEKMRVEFFHNVTKKK